jgi:uncharacterized cupredoxin-like copper-binding protein
MSCRLVASVSSVMALGAIVVAGCAPAPAKVAPTDITLSDYSIAVPASMTASMASFNVVNKGKEPHQAGLVRLDSGKTFADMQAVFQDTTRKGPPPSWIVWMGGPQAFPGGGASDFTVALEPGNYVWYCLIPGPDGQPHLMKGMAAPMTVTPSTTAMAAAPTADIDVTMKDYDWDISKPITAGKHTLKITNAQGAQPHEFVLVKLVDGKSAPDFLAYAEKMEGAPPVTTLNGTAIMQPGQVNYQTVDFTPGKYGLFCFVPDGADGKPHAMHGMVKEITVQ